MSNGSENEFFKKVMALALVLAYDGLPPGDGGADLSIYTGQEILIIQDDMERHIIAELSARRALNTKEQ